MRDAVSRLGGDPEKINPVCPADLVIDHSIQVDVSRRYFGLRTGTYGCTCIIMGLVARKPVFRVFDKVIVPDKDGLCT